MTTKLAPIQATAADLATAHARRIVRAINDMAEAVAASYADHPATPAKVILDPATKQPRAVPSHPGCARADIQSRLGEPNRELVDTILAALASPVPAPASSAPAPIPAAPPVQPRRTPAA